MDEIKITLYQSPLGEMLLGSLDDKLCLCDWANAKQREYTDQRMCQYFNAVYKKDTSEVLEKAIVQLNEYFFAQRKSFSIPVAFAGTPFKRRVWDELMKTEYGTTTSYYNMAQRIGNSGAVRAVAAALASNPVSIIVPCHRVIGRDGRITGYRGGICVKESLLALENGVRGELFSTPWR